ncbi:MAG: hypothetical protein FWC84_06335 [Alphaproteobacteria bacterium]|nr:hypothetical protein [Alphaproteobacteria bacterium]
MTTIVLLLIIAGHPVMQKEFTAPVEACAMTQAMQGRVNIKGRWLKVIIRAACK